MERTFQYRVATEVLVKIDAPPIQPADFMFVEGRYRIKPVLPQIAGFKGTGIVVQTASPNTQGSRINAHEPH